MDRYGVRDAPGWTWKANGRGNGGRFDVLTPGVGFDRNIRQIDQLATKGDHEGIERLNAEYDVTVVGPSVADRLGIA